MDGCKDTLAQFEAEAYSNELAESPGGPEVASIRARDREDTDDTDDTDDTEGTPER